MFKQGKEELWFSFLLVWWWWWGVLLLYLAKSWVVGSQSLRWEKGGKKGGGGKKKEKKKEEKEIISLQTKHEWLFTQYGPLLQFHQLSMTSGFSFTRCGYTTHYNFKFTNNTIIEWIFKLVELVHLYYEGGGF